MLEKFSLSGKVVLVTGAGQGIGEATARLVAESGAKLVAADINTTSLQRTVNHITDLGREVMGCPVNITDAGQIDALIENVITRFGRIDVLMNNAGGMSPGETGNILEMSEESWCRAVDLNLKGTFLMCKAIAPLMLKQGQGSIVNWASMAGLMTYPVAPHYGAAKAGVINLTKNLAAQLAPYVRVNAVAPGIIDTPLVNAMWEKAPELRQKRLQKILLKRVGSPEEVAYTAIFLASDAASYLTGEVISVGGGLIDYF